MAISKTIHTVSISGNSYRINPDWNHIDICLDSDGETRFLRDGVDITDIIMSMLDKCVEEIEKNKVIPRPADPMKYVQFNYEKGVTTAVWKDGIVTMIHCNEEEFDEEKAIAMCFMKKFFDNRGCYYEFMRKYIDKAVIV